MEEEFSSYKEKQEYYRNRSKQAKVLYTANKGGQPYNKRREQYKRMKMKAMIEKYIKEREKNNDTKESV